MWLTLVAGGFFGILLLVTLLRADRSLANGALTFIALVMTGTAVAAAIGGFGPRYGAASSEPRSPQYGGLAALALHRRPGRGPVLSACEKSLFGSPDAAAAAVPTRLPNWYGCRLRVIWEPVETSIPNWKCYVAR